MRRTPATIRNNTFADISCFGHDHQGDRRARPLVVNERTLSFHFTQVFDVIFVDLKNDKTRCFDVFTPNSGCAALNHSGRQHPKDYNFKRQQNS